jgi:hypothetical protein
MLEETYLERIERLAYKDQQKVSATRQALAQTLYSDCTFKPSINPKSKRIAKVCIEAGFDLYCQSMSKDRLRWECVVKGRSRNAIHLFSSA